MRTERITCFRSECGKYLCRPFGSCNFEAWTVDHSIHWRNDTRDAKRYPLEFCVGGYSAERPGQKAGSFTLDLLTCNPKKVIKPFNGNTVVDSLKVVFRRKVLLSPKSLPGANRND